jgi:hypothetical protein
MSWKRYQLDRGAAALLAQRRQSMSFSVRASILFLGAVWRPEFRN